MNDEGFFVVGRSVSWFGEVEGRATQLGISLLPPKSPGLTTSKALDTCAPTTTTPHLRHRSICCAFETPKQEIVRLTLWPGDPTQ